ncbi:hypothetical protein [Paraburkholderia antibiotica]|uniref:Uncharacterized protein n=1 Tax=Paraburkholderia antibiotica TaxID=2728839 RepID=A0A7Y0FGP4_9BURK|nr:hypothetical protein [Paraburkholderia antibiotica]NML35357.1 hypothetical protein [Paraburkholderia antibiotica]
MSPSQTTWGWDLATHGETLAVALGDYPSFHDSAVRSFCMQRGRQTEEGSAGRPLTGTRTREVVDVRLEVLHNRYGSPSVDGRLDQIIVIDCLDVRTSEIDVNAMLEEATIMEMTLAEAPDGLIRLDLLPNVGLDIRLTCKEVVIVDMRPYVREVS